MARWASSHDSARVQAVSSAHDQRMDAAPPQPGPLGLAGGDEFHAGNEPADAILAAAALDSGPAYVIATAARSRPEMAVGQAQTWFQQFGLDLSELAVHTKRQAGDAAIADAAAHAGFFYITGGDPGFVASVLRGSLVGDAMIAAWQKGAVLAGSSAGAMALCAHTLVRRSFPGHSERRAALGLGVVPDSAVLPHLDTFGQAWFPSARRALPTATLIGVDERTCALWQSGRWRCLGRGGVTVSVPGRDSARFAAGLIEGLPQPSTLSLPLSSGSAQ
jgi:cyanophycinase